jgi:hypothetical protein
VILKTDPTPPSAERLGIKSWGVITPKPTPSKRKAKLMIRLKRVSFVKYSEI